jgi:hypothetical protein
LDAREGDVIPDTQMRRIHLDHDDASKRAKKIVAIFATQIQRESVRLQLSSIPIRPSFEWQSSFERMRDRGVTVLAAQPN